MQRLNPNKADALSVVAALMVRPELQSAINRIETLQHLVVAYSNGKDLVTDELLDRLINRWLRNEIANSEEQPADAFVVNVATPRGNRRLLTGDWEAADYWVRTLLAVIEPMPDDEHSREIKSNFLGLLAISEEIIGKIGLDRNIPSTQRDS